MEIVTALFGVLYFAAISKNWIGYIAIGYVMGLVGTVCVYFLPESPKYLFMKGHYEETARILNIIARNNNTEV